MGRAGEPVRARLRGDRPGRSSRRDPRRGDPVRPPAARGRHDRRLRARRVRTTTAATSNGPSSGGSRKGYRVKLTDGVWDQDDYVAGTPEQRAADLNALFADPEVDVIQVLWGGTGAMQMLPLLDYDLIAANPKALMGYSDITNLHIAIRQRTGLATLHGPGLGSMGIPDRTAFTWDSALAGFTTGAAGEVPRDPDDPYVRAIAPGQGHRADRRRQPVHVRAPDRHALRSGVRRRDPVLRRGARARVRDRGPPGPAAAGGQARRHRRGGRGRDEGLRLERGEDRRRRATVRSRMSWSGI